MVRIQQLDASYSEPYRTLFLQAYREHPEAFTSSEAERAAFPVSWWSKRLTQGDPPLSFVLGAFLDDVLVGSVSVKFGSREKVRHTATIVAMYVHAEVQRRGVGRQLLEEAVAVAEAHPDIQLIQLSVSQGNEAAVGLYEKAGFRVAGVLPYAIRVGDKYVAKITMWRPLKDLEKFHEEG